MVKSKFVLLFGTVILMSLSSCGIFKKGCGCPHFGKIKTQHVQMCKYAGVQMIG
jgi:hypothetical protein